MPAEPVGPERPLVLTAPPAGRFVPGLTLSSPLCVSCAVIYGLVRGSQAIHLQIGSAFGIIS